MTNHPTISSKPPGKLAYVYDPDDLLVELNNCVKGRSIREIADFGSGNGLHAIHIAQAYPSARVSAIEPDKDFFQSALVNASAAQVKNLELLNSNIEQYFYRVENKTLDLIHCCMVFPFLTSPTETLKNFFDALSPQGVAIITTFATSENYTPHRRIAAEEYMRRALPSVIFFPTQTQFAGMLKNSGFKILKTAHLPLPYRERNAELMEFRKSHVANRKKIESEILKELNLDPENASPLTRIVTFFVSK